MYVLSNVARQWTFTYNRNKFRELLLIMCVFVIIVYFFKSKEIWEIRQDIDLDRIRQKQHGADIESLRIKLLSGLVQEQKQRQLEIKAKLDSTKDALISMLMKQVDIRISDVVTRMKDVEKQTNEHEVQLNELSDRVDVMYKRGQKTKTDLDKVVKTLAFLATKMSKYDLGNISNTTKKSDVNG